MTTTSQSDWLSSRLFFRQGVFRECLLRAGASGDGPTEGLAGEHVGRKGDPAVDMYDGVWQHGRLVEANGLAADRDRNPRGVLRNGISWMRKGYAYDAVEAGTEAE